MVDKVPGPDTQMHRVDEYSPYQKRPDSISNMPSNGDYTITQEEMNENINRMANKNIMLKCMVWGSIIGAVVLGAIGGTLGGPMAGFFAGVAGMVIGGIVGIAVGCLAVAARTIGLAIYNALANREGQSAQDPLLENY